MPEDVLLTARKVADRLAVKLCTVRRWTLRRKIPYIKLPGSRAVRFRESDIQELIRDGLQPALRPLQTPEDPSDGENRGGR
jgi:excisionase family DNA binding protein